MNYYNSKITSYKGNVMSKKIVAIGGGSNGRVKEDGTKTPYETREIDEEIVNLTGKRNPNFLFLAHSQTKESDEISYFDTMKKIYGNLFGCKCKSIKKKDLKNNFEKARELVSWADIIYEGGGDTKGMIELWIETSFDKVLLNAWKNGKVICGVSAGANCWFKSCSSDSLKIQLKDETAPMINVDCLNFIDAFFTPHCNIKNEYTDRLGHMKESIKNKDIVGIGISNCCALEIIDDRYKLITTNASAYGIKAYWADTKYIEEKIDSSQEFKKLNELLLANAN